MTDGWEWNLVENSYLCTRQECEYDNNSNLINKLTRMKNEEKKKKLQPISDEMLEQENGGLTHYSSSDPYECYGLSKEACQSKSICRWINYTLSCGPKMDRPF